MQNTNHKLFPTVKWEDFSNGGSLTQICIRFLVGDHYGSDEVYRKAWFIVSVAPANEGGYKTILNSDPDLTIFFEADNLGSAKDRALGYLARFIGDNYLLPLLLEEAGQESRKSAVA